MLSEDATGTVLASGGAFASSETTSFCVGDGEVKYGVSNASSNGQEEGSFFKVAPNPFEDYIEISTNVKGSMKYIITNMQGQQVKTGMLQGDRLLLNDIDSGIYIVTFSSDYKQIVRKLVKR